MALNPLVSQAVGAQRPEQGGRWLQLALVIMAVASVAIMAVVWAGIPVMDVLASNHEEAAAAKAFLAVSPLYLVPIFYFQALRQYLQAQGIVKPEFAIAVLGLGVSAVTHYVFVFKLDGGATGSALASAAVSVFQLACITVYIVCQRQHLAWVPWTRDSFSVAYLKEYVVKFALPISLMSVTDEWAFNSLLFAASGLGSTATGAQAVLLRLWDCMWGVTWGVGMASQVRVGFFVGAGDIDGARATFRQGLKVSAAFACANATLLLALSRPVATLFTDDAAVIDEVHTAAWGLAAAHVLSIMTLLCVVVLQGAGVPGRVSVLSTVITWLVGVPAAVGLGFGTPLGVLGMWLGIAGAEVFRLTAVSCLSSRLDWDRAVAQAKRRMAPAPPGSGDGAAHLPTDGADSSDMTLLLSRPAGGDVDDVHAEVGVELVPLAGKHPQQHPAGDGSGESDL